MVWDYVGWVGSGLPPLPRSFSRPLGPQVNRSTPPGTNRTTRLPQQKGKPGPNLARKRLRGRKSILVGLDSAPIVATKETPHRSKLVPNVGSNPGPSRFCFPACHASRNPHHLRSQRPPPMGITTHRLPLACRQKCPRYKKLSLSSKRLATHLASYPPSPPNWPKPRPNLLPSSHWWTSLWPQPKLTRRPKMR